MFAVAQVYRLGVSIKRGGDEFAVGPDEHTLNARRRHQGDDLGPRLEVEGRTFPMHFGDDEFHRGADAAEEVAHFIREGGGQIGAVGLRTLQGSLSGEQHRGCDDGP